MTQEEIHVLEQHLHSEKLIFLYRVAPNAAPLPMLVERLHEYDGADFATITDNRCWYKSVDLAHADLDSFYRLVPCSMGAEEGPKEQC